MLADRHISLMHGWIPGTVQAVSVTALLLAIDGDRAAGGCYRCPRRQLSESA
jgi:hypothetical protein